MRQYFKEFFYGVTAVSIIFASAVLALFIFFFPFALAYLIQLITGMAWLGFAFILPAYALMYALIRHYNIIEKLENI